MIHLIKYRIEAPNLNELSRHIPKQPLNAFTLLHIEVAKIYQTVARAAVITRCFRSVTDVIFTLNLAAS